MLLSGPMDDPQPEPFLPFLDQLDITLWTNSVSASLDSLPHSGIDTGLLSLETFLELSSRSRHAEGKKDDNLSVTSSMDDSAYMSQPDTLRSPLERTYKAVPASAITRSNLFDSNSQSFGLDLQAHTVVQTQALQADPGVFLSTTGKSRHTRSSYGMQRTSPDDSLPLYSIQDHLLLSPDLSYDTKGLGPWETTARQFAHSNGATGHLDRNSAFANDIGFLPQQNSDSLDYLYPSLGFAQDTGLNFSSLETGPAATEQEAVSKVFKKKGPVSGVNGRYSISEDQTPPCPQGSGNLIRRESDPGASIQSHLESTRRLPQRQPVPTIETGNWSRNGAAGNSASDLSSKRVDYVQG